MCFLYLPFLGCCFHHLLFLCILLLHPWSFWHWSSDSRVSAGVLMKLVIWWGTRGGAPRVLFHQMLALDLTAYSLPEEEHVEKATGWCQHLPNLCYILYLWTAQTFQTSWYSSWSTVDLPKISPHVRLDWPRVPAAGRPAAKTGSLFRIFIAALFQALPSRLTYFPCWMGQIAWSPTFANILCSIVPVFLRTGISFLSLSSPVETCTTSVPTGDQTSQSKSTPASGCWEPVKTGEVQHGSIGPSSVCCLLPVCPRWMLNCHVMEFPLRQAQICPNLPNLSELAHDRWRPPTCVDTETLVSTFKSFAPSFSLISSH